jgi:CDP-diglyceride synthetase
LSRTTSPPGKRFTSRPFLSISPNKTWEGFFGGGICTVIFAYLFPLLLVRFFHSTICPCEVSNLGSWLFLMHCSTFFIPAIYSLLHLIDCLSCFMLASALSRPATARPILPLHHLPVRGDFLAAS